MCDQESHEGLPQPRHFTAHTIAVMSELAIVRHRGADQKVISSLQQNAKTALGLVNKEVTTSECTEMLKRASAGDIDRLTAQDAR